MRDLTPAERRLREEKRELRLYVDLLSRADRSLQDVVEEGDRARAVALQTWAESSEVPERRPKGFGALRKWLFEEGRNAPQLYMPLRQPKVQTAAARLYRAYRKRMREHPRWDDARGRPYTWDDDAAAKQVCAQLYGKDGWAPEQLRRTARSLVAWRKAPKQHPLPAPALHALLPAVIGMAAYHGQGKIDDVK